MVAVAVAAGDGRDAHGPVRREGAPVADRVPGLNLLHMGDAGAPAHEGLQWQIGGHRRVAVHGDTHAHHIEGGLRHEPVDGGGVGAVAQDALRQQRAERPEAFQLLTGEGHVLAVRVGKVGERAGQRQVRAGVQRGQHRPHLRLVPCADAAHAGIQLEVYLHPSLAHGGGERPHRGRVADGQRQVVPGCQGPVLGQRGAKHQNWRMNAALPQRGALLRQRHRQPGGTGLQRGAGHLHRAMTVGVRLDHRQQPGALGHGAADQPHVLPQLRQVNAAPGKELFHTSVAFSYPQIASIHPKGELVLYYSTQAAQRKERIRTNPVRKRCGAREKPPGSDRRPTGCGKRAEGKEEKLEICKKLC